MKDKIKKEVGDYIREKYNGIEAFPVGLRETEEAVEMLMSRVSQSIFEEIEKINPDIVNNEDYLKLKKDYI